MTLSESAEVAYKATNYYAKESEITIKYNDPNIGINWPNDKRLIISQKDFLGDLFIKMLIIENFLLRS